MTSYPVLSTVQMYLWHSEPVISNLNMDHCEWIGNKKTLYPVSQKCHYTDSTKRGFVPMFDWTSVSCKGSFWADRGFPLLLRPRVQAHQCHSIYKADEQPSAATLGRSVQGTLSACSQEAIQSQWRMNAWSRICNRLRLQQPSSVANLWEGSGGACPWVVGQAVIFWQKMFQWLGMPVSKDSMCFAFLQSQGIQWQGLGSMVQRVGCWGFKKGTCACFQDFILLAHTVVSLDSQTDSWKLAWFPICIIMCWIQCQSVSGFHPAKRQGAGMYWAFEHP